MIVGERKRCKVKDCDEPATRRAMCSKHYFREYRADRAKRAAAEARANATCRARGCSRPLGDGSADGLCHRCFMRRWREDQRLGPVELSRPSPT